jgi:hypothetical protein
MLLKIYKKNLIQLRKEGKKTPGLPEARDATHLESPFIPVMVMKVVAVPVVKDGVSKDKCPWDL